MDQKELFYVLFWSFAISFLLFFMGFGEKTLFLFSLSLVGASFAEKMGKMVHALGAAFLALAFAAYFAKASSFLGPLFIASALFLILPFILLELRKKIRKQSPSHS